MVVIDPELGKTPSRQRLSIEYSARGPIYINGNSEFTAENGVVGGSGTASDPYVIEGWEILEPSVDGIRIENTDAYFVVRDCYVHDGIYGISGISLSNCANGILKDNNCSGNGQAGISLFCSDTITIVNNTCVGNFWEEIVVDRSSNNTIVNNTLTGYVCIILCGESSNNTVINNECWSGTECIVLKESSNNTIANNNLRSYDSDCIWSWYSSNNALMDNECCSNGEGFGINLLLTHDSTIVNNSCSDNCDGIYLADSNGNYVANNTCSSNRWAGIWLDDSSNNTVVNNACLNDTYGIYLEYSSGTLLNGNMMNGCGVLIEGDDLSHWNTHEIDTSNRANGNPVYYYKDQNGMVVPAGAGQVILTNCTGFVIGNQDLGNTTVGVLLGFSSSVLLTNSDCSNNQEAGVWLYRSTRNTIANNDCSKNIYGIYLDSSSNNILINNSCSSNSECGIELIGSSNNTLSHNTCGQNKHVGIHLVMSSNSGMLVDNTCNSNWNTGIALEFECNNSMLANNSCSSNGNLGIYLRYTSNNTLVDNDCSWNDNVGIFLDNSENCRISRNLLRENYGWGVGLGETFNIRVWNNTFVNNNLLTPNHIQAGDYSPSCNSWDNGYPSGGNYWSDYTGIDEMSGPNQDQPGSDGIGDTPYVIDADSQDRYPLMQPYSWTNTPPTPSFTVTPSQGTTETIFTFNASASWDEQDQVDSLQVRWDWEHDGLWDTPWSYTKSAQHQYATAGAYVVRLAVLDTGGLEGQATKTIVVSHETGALWYTDPSFEIASLKLNIIGEIGFGWVTLSYPLSLSVHFIVPTAGVTQEVFAQRVLGYFGYELNPSSIQSAFVVVTIDGLLPYIAAINEAYNWTLSWLGGPFTIIDHVGFLFNSTGCLTVFGFFEMYDPQPVALEDLVYDWASSLVSYFKNSDPLELFKVLLAALETVTEFLNFGAGILKPIAHDVFDVLVDWSLVKTYDLLCTLGKILSSCEKAVKFVCEIGMAGLWAATVLKAVWHGFAAAVRGLDLVLEWLVPDNPLSSILTFLLSVVDPDNTTIYPAVEQDGGLLLGRSAVNGSMLWSAEGVGFIVGGMCNGDYYWQGFLSEGFIESEYVLYCVGNESVGVPYMLSLATNGTSPSATTFGTLNGSESVTYVAISVNNTVVLGAVPIAEFSASSEVGDLATVFEFDATACYDLEDPLEMLEVRWDFDGDGVWDTDWTTEKVAYHQYTTPGNYTVWLEVRDTQGLTNFTEMSIEVWEIIPEFSTVIVPILSLLFLVAVVARSRLRRDMRRKPG